MSKHHNKNKQQTNSPHVSELSIQDIEELAFRIHEEKGGTDLENWLEAEQILREKH